MRVRASDPLENLIWANIGAIAAHQSRASEARTVLAQGDALSQFAKAKELNWMKVAKDRNGWSALEDEFAAKRW